MATKWIGELACRWCEHLARVGIEKDGAGRTYRVHCEHCGVHEQVGMSWPTGKRIAWLLDLMAAPAETVATLAAEVMAMRPDSDEQVKKLEILFDAHQETDQLIENGHLNGVQFVEDRLRLERQMMGNRKREA